MVNKVILIGNLGQDPETRNTQGGQTVCNLRVATTDKYKDREGAWVDRTEWHTVTVWGKQAEACGQYLHKGKQVYVEGRLQTRKWQDKEGKDRYSTEVVADNVRFLGGREESGQREERRELEQGRGRGGGGEQYRDPAPGADDDIPFLLPAYIRHGRDI